MAKLCSVSGKKWGSLEIYVLKITSIQIKRQHVLLKYQNVHLLYIRQRQEDHHLPLTVCVCVCVHILQCFHSPHQLIDTHWFINNVHLGSAHCPGRFTALRTGCFCQATPQSTIFLTLSHFISLPTFASQSIPQPLYLCSLSLYCPPPHPCHSLIFSRTSGFLWTVSLSLFLLARCVFFATANLCVSGPVVYLLGARTGQRRGVGGGSVYCVSML